MVIDRNGSGKVLGKFVGAEEETRNADIKRESLRVNRGEGGVSDRGDEGWGSRCGGWRMEAAAAAAAMSVVGKDLVCTKND